MTDFTVIERFLRAVVPWPASDQDAGYVNLHFIKAGRHGVGGWAFKDVTKLTQMIAFALQHPDQYRDMWQCMSLQRESKGPNRSGKNHIAERKAEKAIAFRSMWIDLDLDPNDPKKYPDEKAALKAVLGFCKENSLPDPSAIVHSGNGLHMYWCSDKDLTPDEWRPLAEGFKALLLAKGIKIDPTVTADAARIMRVPETMNCKSNPPKPVRLLTPNITAHDFSTKPFQDLKTHYTPSAVPKVQSDIFDAAAFAGKKPHPLMKGLDVQGDKLSAGCERLLDPKPIFNQCPMYDEALKTGGAGYDQGLWMLQVLGTTFMEGGNDLAHAISKGHATYSPNDTDQMFSRKVADRDQFGIGYPSCAKFKGAGSKACENCPIFAAGKSPLNLKTFAPVTAPVTVRSSNPATILGTVDDPDTWMPYDHDYDFDNNGIICKLIRRKDKAGNELEPVYVPLFRAVVAGYWLSKGGQGVETLHFVASVDKGCTVQADAPITEFGKREFRNFLLQQRVLTNPKAAEWIEDFHVSVMEKLRAANEAVTTVPYGWYYDNKNERRGFCYAGKVFLDDGTERPAGSTDPHILRNYSPVGKLEDWMKVARCVTDRQRPELTIILLMSFMSPLLELVGRSTVVMSAHGTDSGGGKSSAYQAGMSVWGHPVKTKGTEDQTKNNITTIMKTIRNLPFYMDEITDDKHREMFRKVFHEADGSKEKGRNIDGRRVQDVGTWSLAIHYASNNSLLSFLRKHDEHSVYSVSRVLEFEVARIDGGPGWMPDAEATVLIDSAQRNYGHMGLKYSRYLADHHKVIAKDCIAKIVEMEKVLEAGNTERYWSAGVGLMVQAAKYAREMGLDVDPATIEQFMIQVYRKNRQARDEFFGGGSVDKSEDALTRYLQEREAQERGLWTDHIALGKGRSAVRVVNVLKGPTQAKNTGAVSFRFAVEQHLLIITRADFDAWRIEQRIPDAVVDNMKTQRGLLFRRWAHLKGWKQDAGRQWCMVIPVQPNTALWDYMMSAVADQSERARIAAIAPAPIEEDAA